MTLGYLISALILSVLIPNAVSHAAPSSAPTLSERELRSLAQDEVMRGESAFKQSKLRLGIKHYERAYRHIPSPELLHKIALTYDKIPSACSESLRAWRRFRLRCKSCDLKSHATRGYFDVKSRCQRIVHIKAPDGVSVLIDQEQFGGAPLSTTLMVGSHKIELIRDDKTVYKGSFKVTLKGANKAKGLSLNFVKSGAKLKLKTRAKARRVKRRVSKKRDRINKKHKRHTRTQSQHRDQSQALGSSPVIAQSDHKMELNHKGVVINASLQCEYKKEGRYYPFPDCDGAQLQANDRFRVIFTARQDSYAYLFLSNGRGARTMLFPDPEIDNFARAGVEYVIPGQGWYELDDEGGTTERLHMIVSRERVDALERSRGLNLTPRTIAQLKQMSFRGVRRMQRPASMSERLRELDTVIQARGNSDVASVNFSIQHD